MLVPTYAGQKGMLLKSADNDRRIVPAEAKAVAHGVLKPAFASRIRSVVQIAIRIGICEIDRRRYRAMHERLDRHHCLNSAAGPERVSKLALRATNGDL